MHRSFFFARLAAVGAMTLTLGAAGTARADVIVGDDAPLFVSVDEHMSPVDMADLIVGRPLVMAVGSASWQPSYLNFHVMEALYEDYGDRVNFLWVYGSEAHPEEDPFAEGYESKDLGWSHPYTFTHTMQERAQRALWMKTDPDPDLTMPMLVDYVGHSTLADNAIRTAYFGYGYYSGYVIDCDGVVKVAHDWGWYGPGGEWWGLPLASEAELRVWLDAYLADPPPCYDGPTPPEPDAGVPEPDASVPSDAGVVGPDAAPDGGSGNGGGCSTAGGSPALPLPLVLGLLLGLIRRRRQSAAPTPRDR